MPTSDETTGEPALWAVARARMDARAKPPRGWVRWPAVLLALLGWWLSFDLVQLSFGRPASNPWLEARCGSGSSTGGTFDCQSVLASKWAQIPREPESGKTGMPVAAFGMGYFAFVGLWYLLLGCPTRKRWGWHLLLALIIGCGVLQSVEMMDVMGRVLHKWCAGCVAVHAVNGALALLTLLAFPWRADRPGTVPHPNARAAIATLAACFFLFLLHPAVVRILMTSRSANQIYEEYAKIVDNPAFARWEYERQPVQEIPPAKERVFFGDPAAPNVVVAFIDVQCTACMSASKLLDRILEDHPESLRIVYRHFPQDPACNEGWVGSGHPGSCEAARALEAAAIVGGAEGFREMRALLYEHRNQLAGAPYAQWAGELGLDVSAFSAALASDEVKRRVHDDIELGKRLGVEAVPVLFLNGRRLSHWSNVKTWDALLGLESSAPANTPMLP